MFPFERNALRFLALFLCNVSYFMAGASSGLHDACVKFLDWTCDDREKF